MMKHTRIYCHECKRQRLDPKRYFANSAPLTITGNKRDDLCIYCGSAQIEEVQYEPPFLGGDYMSESISLEVINTGDDYDPTQVKEGTPGLVMNNTISMV